MNPQTQQKALERIDSCIVQIDKAIAAYEARISSFQAAPVPSDEAAPGAQLAPPPPALAPPPPAPGIPPHVALRTATVIAGGLIADMRLRDAENDTYTVKVERQIDEDNNLKLNHKLEIKLDEVPIVPATPVAPPAPIFIQVDLKALASLGVHLVYNRSDCVGVEPKPNAQPIAGGVNASIGCELAAELSGGLPSSYGIKAKIYAEIAVSLAVEGEVTVKGSEYEVSLSIPLKAAFNVGYNLLDIYSDVYVVGELEILKVEGLKVLIDGRGKATVVTASLRVKLGSGIQKMVDGLTNVVDNAIEEIAKDPAKLAILMGGGLIMGPALLAALRGVNVTESIGNAGRAALDTAGDVADTVGDGIHDVGEFFGIVDDDGR